MSKKNTILVTGATSQIGVFLLPLLTRYYSDSTIYALSRYTQNACLNVQWIQADIKDLDKAIFNNINIDIVIQLSEITLSVLILMKIKTVKRVIVFSSSSVITKQYSNDIKDRQQALELLNGEKKLVTYCNDNAITWTIFRPTMIYGADLDKNVKFISTFIKTYHFFPMLANKDGLRQPVHAVDLAIACIRALDTKMTENKTYILAGGEILSNSNMIKRVFESLNKKVCIVSIPRFLLSGIISLVGFLPQYRHLTSGMVGRLNQELIFDNKEAKLDFNFEPKMFMPNKKISDVL